jgi:hypothetical protein
VELGVVGTGGLISSYANVGSDRMGALQFELKRAARSHVADFLSPF